MKFKVKSQRDFWSGLMFVAIGAAFSIGSLNYSFGNSARPGPAYFPFGLGLLLVALGLGVVTSSLTKDTTDGEKIGKWAWKPVIWIASSIALFGWSIPVLGLFVSLPSLIVITSMAGPEFKWREAIVNAVLITTGSWLLFIKALKLLIPLWPSFIVS